MSYRNIFPNAVNHVDGLVVSWTSNTVLAISAGSCKDSFNNFDMTLQSAASVSSAFTGAGGLDTGTIAAADVYAVYLIGSMTVPGKISTLLSLSATAPVMPTGYDMFRRIGWAITASSNFTKAIVTGSSSNRTYWLDSAVSVLSGGSSATLAAVDLSATVPTINTKVYLNASFTPNAASDTAGITSGTSVATAILKMTGVVAAEEQSVQLITLATVVSNAPTVQYIVTASGALTLLVTAFEDYL